MTYPGTPRDVDLDGWLDGIGFKPADTVAKQVGHAAAREFIANLGVMLHQLLPAGRDKALVFTALEDVLMRSNRALALGGGPAVQDDEFIEELKAQIAASPVGLPRDRRYEAEQRGETIDTPHKWEWTDTNTYRYVNGAGAQLVVRELRGNDGAGAVLVTVHDAPEEDTDPLDVAVADVFITNADAAQEVSSAILTASNNLWSGTA